MTHRLPLSIVAMLLSTVLLSSCRDPVGLLPPGLAIFSGDEQSGVAGQPLAQPLVVTVADGRGRGVEGAQIHWDVTTGGGGISFLTYTDATGRASATWTLGVVGRTQTARASVSMLADSSPGSSPPVIFAATANGAATGLVLIAGNSQAAIIDDTLPVPLRVRATNEAGAGVAGVLVTWAAAGGGQVLSRNATDAQGEAVVTWVLGPRVGAQTATAAVTGLSGSPLTFSATANPAANTLSWASEQQLPPCSAPGLVGAGIWVSSSGDVFVVCGTGIWHFNGSSWDAQASGTTRYLFAVWGSSPGDVFAVGDSGTILHYDASNWTTQPASRFPAPFAIPWRIASVWGTSATDVFAVGSDPWNSDVGYTVVSPLWHYDGTTWTADTVGGCFLRAVWGSSSADVFAVGDGVLHYDGATWNRLVSGNCALPGRPGVRFTGVWGSGPADVYAVGYDVVVCGRTCRKSSTFIDHYDGANWQRSLTDSSAYLTAVWGTANAEVVAVGAAGLILHSDGTRWRREASGTGDAVLAVSGRSARDVWAITSSGLVLHGTR